MSELKFESNGVLTLGVEIEVQLIDSKNMNLYPVALDILSRINSEKVKPEIFQSMIEVNTGICQNVHEAMSDLKNTFAQLYEVCQNLNIECATTGTHPFAQYNERVLFPSKRYDTLIDRNQWIARRLSIFGLHVHLGMSSKEECISFMNFFQHFFPHLVALSASSPFWQEQNTGLASSRLTVFEASPTSGHNQGFKNWEEFETQYNSLLNIGAIQSTKDLWWDIRPSPHFGTLEIRICDGVATFHELLGILAFIHSLAHWFNGLDRSDRMNSKYNNLPELWVIRENKWRALRYGLEMQLIKDGENKPIKEDFLEILDMLNETFILLRYNDYAEHIRKIIAHGNSSDRQLACFHKYDCLQQVTHMNIMEFKNSYILGSPNLNNN